jgi:outer membrane protein assembly factor BamD (BamD/ComL family)
MTAPLRLSPDFCKVCLLIIASVSLTSCYKAAETRPSLADIDVSPDNLSVGDSHIEPKSEEEIRMAYYNYLSSADIDDNSRVNALNRLADLEYDYSTSLLRRDENQEGKISNDTTDILYDAQLTKTITLLNAAIKDYPSADNLDTLLYQLAKAYDQKGAHQQAIEALAIIARDHPKSPYYAEAQFRLAEHAFSNQDYAAAEEAYTEAIYAEENQIFFEKSLFKRGWSRFKQQYYTDAVDDFLDAVLHHEFDSIDTLSKAELEQFNEYFRSIGLAFSYLGGPEPLHDYLQQRPDHRYVYQTYAVLSEIYLQQERYSDAVETLNQYSKYYPDSAKIPYVHLKIIEIWKDSGFIHKLYSAIDDFYLEYNPSSDYWDSREPDSELNREIRQSLRAYIVAIAGYYHNKYQASSRKNDYDNAALWYQRHLEHYSTYAQQDNIYFLYGELLAQNNAYQEAFKYYELAAYENDLIVHRDAAYASIISSYNLLQHNKNHDDYLAKHIDYALRYAQQYPAEARTQKLALHAAEVAYKSGDYKSTIELADIIIANNPANTDNYVVSLKAESYYSLNELEESESIFRELLAMDNLTKDQRTLYENRLARSVYKQGEQAQKDGNIPQAIDHFSRISSLAPYTTIAATGLYDAIALNMQHKQWEQAIDQIHRFRSTYPDHDLQADISKKLSAAYLQSDQGIKAAQEFENMSVLVSDTTVQAAALWQAADLYISKNQPDDAIRSYQEYTRKFPTPYDQYLEAMNKLTELHIEKGETKTANSWRKKIVAADGKALNNVKTERTKHITSYAYLGLAQYEKEQFDTIKLTLPLDKSLRKKKSRMQASIKLYGQASKYRLYEVSTESSYSIALIYKDFSKALLDSDRPSNLNEEELDQYEILLEDQAFPFEDKAIEFFEINLARIKDGFYNDWIRKAHQELKTLFPARYARKPKLDTYIDKLH